MSSERVVAIVGAGHVGTAAAYALFLRRLASEILLVDADAKRAEGEAMDLMHAQALVGPTRVRAVGIDALGDAAIVVLAAGAAQRPGETRLDLLERNARTTVDLIHALDRHAPEAVLLVATNPVDLATHVAQQASARPAGRIVGTGTILDTARFRALLGRHYGLDPRSVHAYIVGEHGDSEVPVWSGATIGGLAIRTTTIRGKSFDEGAMNAIFAEVRDAAYAIIARKGHTDLAIGAAIAQLVEAILDDARSVLPVSVRLQGEYGLDGPCLGLPCVVGREGIDSTLAPPLDEGELAALRSSAVALRERLGGLTHALERTVRADGRATA